MLQQQHSRLRLLPELLALLDKVLEVAELRVLLGYVRPDIIVVFDLPVVAGVDLVDVGVYVAGLQLRGVLSGELLELCPAEAA